MTNIPRSSNSDLRAAHKYQKQKVVGRMKTLELPWLITPDRDDLGGLIALRGIYYQYLYVLRLMSEDLSGQCFGFEKERLEDYLSWGDTSETAGPYVRLIQVRSNAKGCYLGLLGPAKVRKLLAHFARSVSTLSEQLTDRDVTIKCRLVYNAVPGHDCRAKECEKRLAKFPELLAWQLQELSSLENLAAPLELQQFLPLPSNKDDVLQELQFIEEYVPGVLNELSQVDRIADFISTVFGLVVPYHEGMLKGTVAEQTAGQLPLSRLIHTRPDTIAILKEAFETVLHGRELKDAGRRHNADIARARERARIEILAAQTRPSSHPEAGTVRLPLPNEDAVEQALAVLYRLDSGGQPPAFTFAESVVPRSKDGHIVLMAKLREKLMPVGAYFGHKQRVQLLISFATFMSSLSEKGITLTDFRCDQPEYCDWYFVEEHESGPHFLLGDLAVLGLISQDTALLQADRTQGPIVAQALRCLYYGTDDIDRVRNTRIYRAQWNDNIVLELANWLDATPFISSTDLRRELEGVFVDEMHH